MRVCEGVPHRMNDKTGERRRETQHSMREKEADIRVRFMSMGLGNREKIDWETEWEVTAEIDHRAITNS